MTDFTKLRARLLHQFGGALGADPVCGGRVTVDTVGWLADEAVRACEAVRRDVMKSYTQASDASGTYTVADR